MDLFFITEGTIINIITIIVAVLFTALALYQWKWIRTSIGSADWKQSLMYSWVKSLEGFFLKRSIGVQTLILLIVVFFWGFGTMMVFWQPAVINRLDSSDFIDRYSSARCSIKVQNGVLEPSDGENGGNG